MDILVNVVRKVPCQMVSDGNLAGLQNLIVMPKARLPSESEMSLHSTYRKSYYASGVYQEVQSRDYCLLTARASLKG
jgi:hypothetical protein